MVWKCPLIQVEHLSSAFNDHDLVTGIHQQKNVSYINDYVVVVKIR